MSSIAVGPQPLRAVLALARQEGLVEPSRFDTDGVFNNLCGYELSPDVRTSVLQQLLSATELVCPTEGALATVAGDLVDWSYIRVSPLADDDPPEMTISPELVLGLMSEPEPLEKYVTEYHAWEHALDQLNSLLSFRGDPPVSGDPGVIGVALRAMVDRDDQLWAACHAVNLASSQVSPYVTSHRNCRDLLALCERGDCDQMLLIGRSLAAATSDLRYPGTDKAMSSARETVLRFMSTRISLRPYFATLAETIDFARSDEGWEYRQLIDRWAQAALEDSDAAMTTVEREMDAMERRHRLAGAMKGFGRLTTYSGLLVAVGAASAFGLPGAVVGTGVTIAGALAEASGSLLRRRMGWFAVLR